MIFEIMKNNHTMMWLSSIDGNNSSLLIPTPLHSSCDLSTCSEISLVVRASSTVTPFFISFGSMKNSSWLHTGMSYGFSSFELGIGGIRFLTSSRDYAWLIVALWFDKSLLVDCSSTVIADLTSQSRLTDKISCRDRFSISSSSKAKLRACKSLFIRLHVLIGGLLWSLF